MLWLAFVMFNLSQNPAPNLEDSELVLLFKFVCLHEERRLLLGLLLALV